jgi:hypothetical protein
MQIIVNILQLNIFVIPVRGLKGRKVKEDLKELQDRLGHRDLLVHKEQKDLQVLVVQARKELKDLRVL